MIAARGSWAFVVLVPILLGNNTACCPSEGGNPDVCGSPPSSGSPVTITQTETSIRLGETRGVSLTGQPHFLMTLQSVKSDFRCRVVNTTTCEIAKKCDDPPGHATVTLGVSSPTSQQTMRFEVPSCGASPSQRFEGVLVQIESLNPRIEANQEIVPEDYWVRVSVRVN